MTYLPFPSYASNDDATLNPLTIKSRRRARVMLWTMGGFVLVVALAAMGAAVFGDPKQFADIAMKAAPPEARQQLTEQQLIQLLRVIFFAFGAFVMLIAISMLVCGQLVRKGSRKATIFAIILSGTCFLYWLINLGAALLAATGSALLGGAQVIFTLVVLSGFGNCVYWLVSSLRARSPANMPFAPATPHPPGFAPGYGVQATTLPPPPKQPS